VFIFAGAALTKISAGAEFSVFFCAVSVDEVVFSAAACGFSDAAGAVRALAVALLALGLRAAANAAMAGLTGFSVAVLGEAPDAALNILLVDALTTEAAASGFFIDVAGAIDDVCCGALLPSDQSGVKASIRNKVMVKPAYSSGANPNS
jgi:hypothetical protein